jgi:hypothetical protein
MQLSYFFISHLPARVDFGEVFVDQLLPNVFIILILIELHLRLIPGWSA